MPRHSASFVIIDPRIMFQQSAKFREEVIGMLVGQVIEPEDYDDEPLTLTRERATQLCVALYSLFFVN